MKRFEVFLYRGGMGGIRKYCSAVMISFIRISEGNKSHCPPHINRLIHSDYSYTIEWLETEMLQHLEQGLRLLSSGCDAVCCSRYNEPDPYCLQVKEVTRLEGVTYPKTVVVLTNMRYEDISTVTMNHMPASMFPILQHRILEVNSIQIIKQESITVRGNYFTWMAKLNYKFRLLIKQNLAQA